MRCASKNRIKPARAGWHGSSEPLRGFRFERVTERLRTSEALSGSEMDVVFTRTKWSMQRRQLSEMRVRELRAVRCTIVNGDPR
jgi:hypothetical protein